MNSALLYATAKQRINDFCQREYEGQAVFTDMSKINIAYTTTEDARFEVQAYIDLINYEIVTSVGKDIVNIERYDSLEELVEELRHLDYDTLVSYPDAEDYDFDIIEINEKTALYSNSRIPEYIIPDGWHTYDLRGDDDGGATFLTIERKVYVNHAGSILLPDAFDFGKRTYIELDEDSSPNFLGERMGILEFQERAVSEVLK